VRILVTGTAGFIGFHLAGRLLAQNHEVVGVDGLTPYYDVSLKRARHDILKRSAAFTEAVMMLEDDEALAATFERFAPQAVIHLAAQAGVRYSLENPRAYVDANLVGTFNVMEAARIGASEHLMLASTSSIYGANEKMPFVESDRADTPLTLYAATKKAAELMTHSYSHLWKIPTTVLRFFSVYGPWGRPDMALYKFVEAILAGRPIDLYNRGDMLRDFTYVDDVVKAIDLLMRRPPEQGHAVAGDSLSPVAPWRVVNIGAGSPWRLLDFIGEIERSLGRTAELNHMDIQPGDVRATFADTSLLESLTGYRPDTPPRVGIAAFCDWYREYHRRP
jgi:UDP-glucuronate 4-epimerase